MKTADQLRQEAAHVVWHISPAGDCDCPTAPCGLVVADRVNPDCGTHGYLHPQQSAWDIHPAERCPAITGLEPHHRQARFRTDEEWEAWRRDPANRLVRNLPRETVERGMRIARHFHEETP